jgi:putative transposase
VLDNGLEFLSRDLESVALDLGFDLIFCPKFEPWFKGRIERFLKTINYFFAHQLPGTSFSRYYLRGDYDPQKHAIITFSELKHVFEKWLLDVQAQTLHKGISNTPYAQWQEGATRREPTLPANVRTLNRRIGHVTERSLRRDGLQIDGIRYNGEAANQIVRAYGVGVKVRVVSDSEDLGDIEIWGPESQTPVSVPAVHYAYAKGLTKLQNECVQTLLREKGRAAVDIETLQQAKYAIAQSVQSLMQSRKQRDRRRAAAIRGMSSNHTDADLLQAVRKVKPRPTKARTPPAITHDVAPTPIYSSFRLTT